MNEGSYYGVKAGLIQRLKEPAPGRVQILTGPRQVGKTGILLEIADAMKESALYLAADAPEASLPGWWELQVRNAFQLARKGKAVLLIDEIHYLPHWTRLLKSAIDEVYREKLSLHIVVTGSAALELGAGARETMAGRFERLVLRMWSSKDMATAFSLRKGKAVERFIRFGSFPGGMAFLQDFPRWKAYMRDSILDPALGRDLLMRESVRKPALLRQVFAVCAGHPSEILSLAKLAGSISDKGTLETIAHYLNLLEDAYLVTPVRKHSAREVRRRASPPKVVPMSNAFLAASSAVLPPLPGREPSAWGRWVENACIAFAVGCGQNVSYWREEPLEVDLVTSGSWGRWAVEVKTGEYTARELAGLLEFCRRSPDYRPLVVCDGRRTGLARKVGADALSWEEFLWSGPASL